MDEQEPLAFEAFMKENELRSLHGGGPSEGEETPEEEVYPERRGSIMGGGKTMLIPGNLTLNDGTLIEDITPMEYIEKWFKKRMPEYGPVDAKYEDKILIVKAKTGAGKSTVMPVHLYRILKHTVIGGITCSQPRVLTAQQLAIEQGSSPHYPDMKLKQNVGYVTGNSKLRPRERNGLTYVTVGVLLQIVRTSSDAEIMKQFRIIIMDEVHERSLMLDMALLHIRNFLRRNYAHERCPFLVLTSATFDTEKYANYLGLSLDNVMNVEGQSFPIETFWLERDSRKYVDSIRDTVKRLCIEDNEEYGKDVLIFAPGDKEIKDIERLLVGILPDVMRAGKKPFLILSLTGMKVNSDHIDRRLVFEPYSKLRVNENGSFDPKASHIPDRRVIISTVVAETGLTIDTIGSVIDYGMDRHMEMYAPYGLVGLITTPAAQSKVLQRKGRSGRLFPGRFYPMYTEETFMAMAKQQLPSTIIEDLDRYLLYMLKAIDIKEFAKIDMLDNPPTESLKQALESLYMQGYVGTVPRLHITSLGELLDRTMETEAAEMRMIYAGYIHEVSIQELVTIAAIIGSRAHMVTRSFNKTAISSFFGMEYWEYKVITMDTFIDSLMIYHVAVSMLERYPLTEAIKKIEGAGIKWMGILSILEKRIKVMEDVMRCDLNPLLYSDARIDKQTKGTLFSHVRRLKACIYEGFSSRVLSYDATDDSYHSPHGLKVRLPFWYPCLDKESRDRLKQEMPGYLKKPRYVMYTKLSLENLDKEKFKYEVSAAHVSALDGYIPHDTSAFLPESRKGDVPYPEKAEEMEASASISCIRSYNHMLREIHSIQHAIVRKGMDKKGRCIETILS